FAVAFAGAAEGAFAVAAEGAFAVAAEGAFAVAVAGVVAGVSAVDVLTSRGMGGIARALLTFAVSALWIASAWLLPWGETGLEDRAVFVLLGVFPLLNAVFDAISYAITLALLRWGMRDGRAVLAGVIDAGFALVIYTALTVATILVLAGLNTLAGVPLLDLKALLEALADPEERWNNTWVIFMLLSTLVPTGLHLCCAVLALQTAVPGTPRNRLADMFERAPGHTKSAILAPLLLGLVRWLPFALVGAGLWGFWQVAGDFIVRFLGFLLEAATNLAILVDPVSFPRP
ncbi:MAG: hypothetical protein AAFY03_12150, partial [Pseudomonadota bacterium]